jgi:hypothetical protein
MILSLEEKKKDLVVILSMPPPKADDVVSFFMNVDSCALSQLLSIHWQTWDDGLGDHVENPFDYDEEVAGGGEVEEAVSAKSQIVGILS